MTAIRRPGAASAAVLIGLSVSLVTVHLLAPEWSRRAGLDVWNLAALEGDRRAAAEAREDILVSESKAIARRTAANQIAAKLIAGTTSLPTATDELMEVFQQDTGMPYVLNIYHGEAPTERHRFALHGIDRVRTLLADEPAQCETVVARLEAEYRAMCASPESPHAP